MVAVGTLLWSQARSLPQSTLDSWCAVAKCNVLVWVDSCIWLRFQFEPFFQVDEELCYFVDPPLASTHTSAKLQIKLETPSLSGMYVGITTEERVPIGACSSPT
eukprot:3095672-Amphidinium_carterae.1